MGRVSAECGTHGDNAMRAKLRRIARCLLPILIAASIPILLARCTPQWFPDSRQIVYVAPIGKVTLHNVETMESKQLAQLKFPVAGLAVWPTGDRVAVTHFPTADRQQLQVTVFDLDGNEKHASGKLELKGIGADEKNYLFFMHTFVAPNGKHLVTFLPGNSGAVSYEFETQTFHSYPKVMPIGLFAGMAAAALLDDKKESLPMGFDVPAVTPDSKGFVAIAGDGADARFVYVPWGAKEPIDIKLPHDALAAIEKAGDGEARRQGVGVGAIPSWREGKLVMYLQGGELSIDPIQRKCGFESNMHADGLLQHAEREKAAVIGELAAGGILQFREKKLQIWRRGTEPATLFEYRDGAGILGLSVSPDRRKVLLRVMADEKDTVQVFDLTGRQLAKLQHASFGR